MASFKDLARDKFSIIRVFGISKKDFLHNFIGKLNQNLWILTKIFLNDFFHYMKDYLVDYNQPKVVKKINHDGCEYFKVYDPTSNHYYFFSTEKEVMIWLEQRYHY